MTLTRPVIAAIFSLVACATMFSTVGCSSIGPGTVPRDRAHYSQAIADSWRRQILLNIIKLRYADSPIFVDVGQIVSGYSLETTVTASGNVGTGEDFAIFGGSARFTDRPTVTYVPLTGDAYVTGLLTPIRPEAIFFLIQAGYPADGVLLSSVSSLNGLNNQTSSLSGVTPPDPGFLRVLQLMRQLQLDGGIGMRVETDPQKHPKSIVTFRTQSAMSPEAAATSKELRGLLGLDPEANEFTLVFATVPSNPRELAIVSRSLIQLMQVLSTQADLPAEHVTEGRAIPGWESTDKLPEDTRLIQIHSGEKEPKDASVAVEYRNRWFWIEDRDLRSKRMFNLIMVMFSLADTGKKESLPLITIPAQ